MGLRAQRLSQPTRRVQLAGQGLQIGVVPQGQHGAELASLPTRRCLVDDQDPVRGEVDGVVHLAAALKCLRHRRGQPELVEPVPGPVLGKVEQPACLVVGQQQASVKVQQHQSFADSVQHCVVELVHPGQLVRRQTHGLAPDELARMYEFYDAVLHAVREGLVLLDLDGRLLRDNTDLQALTGELDSARGLAETLRSQAHEAANRLHSVISLIELGRTDQALTFATAELALAQQLTDLVVGAVDEPVLAALLLGKASEANERGVELEVDPESAVPEGVIPARDLVTMVGNLLDNAIDAAAAAPGPRRVGFSSWIEDAPSAYGISSALVLQVSDSGPGLDNTSAALAFTRGWSTKTDGRMSGHGLGLALVGQAAHRHHGTVEVSHVGNAVYGDVASAASSSVSAATCTAEFVGAVFTIRLPLAIESVTP